MVRSASSVCANLSFVGSPAGVGSGNSPAVVTNDLGGLGPDPLIIICNFLLQSAGINIDTRGQLWRIRERFRRLATTRGPACQAAKEKNRPTRFWANYPSWPWLSTMPPSLHSPFAGTARAQSPCRLCLRPDCGVRSYPGIPSVSCRATCRRN